MPSSPLLLRYPSPRPLSWSSDLTRRRTSPLPLRRRRFSVASPFSPSSSFKRKQKAEVSPLGESASCFDLLLSAFCPLLSVEETIRFRRIAAFCLLLTH